MNTPTDTHGRPASPEALVAPPSAPASQFILLHGLEPVTAEGVLADARKRKFNRGDIVFHQGDPGDSIQLIAQGHFALQLTTADGKVYMHRVFGPGDLFGRVALAPIAAVRDMSVVCLEAAETFELFRRQVDELRAAHPVVNDALLVITGLELRRVSERLIEVLYVDADRRVRRRLLDLGDSFRTGEGEWAIPLTQEELASMAGTSRATVSRVLSEEEERGTVVRRRRRIVLLDPEKLKRFA